MHGLLGLRFRPNDPRCKIENYGKSSRFNCILLYFAGGECWSDPFAPACLPFSAVLSQVTPNAFPGASWLYFGCRREEEDFLYKEDWEEFLEDGVLLQMRTAFSRAQEEKVYVQHLMAQDAGALAQLIGAGGYVYVCGDGVGMAKDVHAALVEILVKEGGVESADAAAAQLQAMAQEGRYVRDIWS